MYTNHTTNPKISEASPANAPEGSMRSGAPAAISSSCDLSEGGAQSPSYNSPPVPVLVAFGAGRLSECRLEGRWDFDRAVAANPEWVVRSVKRLGEDTETNKWEDLILQIGKMEFLYCNNFCISAYAATHDAAERLARDFTATYGKEKPENGGSFQLIRREAHEEIVCENVQLRPESVLSEESFVLHYPGDVAAWHRSFVDRLNARRSGLSILEGRPGTGKTSYLRHLMGVLRDSHRFYFIPPTNLSILVNPEFIGFWSRQRKSYPDFKMIVILEDAEEALMPREADNRDKVSAILNLSDGMLSDFVELQVICTINCSAAEIDQALMRPGRLVSHRIFKRLDRAQASALSESLGKRLPIADDYSLAEVFAGEEEVFRCRLPIGFSS